MPGADDRHLGHGRVGGHLAEAELADDRLEDPLGPGQLERGDGEAHVGRAAVADVLDDHVDVDPGVGQRREDRLGDARPVGHGDQGDLGHVPVVGQAADLVALLHERILLDEGTRRVLERAQDLDDDAVDPAELDRPDLHDLGALVGQLEHLLVADHRQLPGIGHDPRIGREDAPHVGEDLAAIGPEPGGQGDGRGVRAAPAEGRRLGLVAGRVALTPWKPATITTLPRARAPGGPGPARRWRSGPGRSGRRCGSRPGRRSG